MADGLDALLQDPRIFRSGKGQLQADAVVPTGLKALDARLPGRGWPRGVLVELLAQQWGQGELRLLMPALSCLSEQGRWLVWISPPYVPYAPALAAHDIHPRHCLITRPESNDERIWVAEQALTSGACGAVLLWEASLTARHARRLQLAAESASALAFVFRHHQAAVQRSPAALRLKLYGHAEGLHVSLFKVRGGRTGDVFLPLD